MVWYTSVKELDGLRGVHLVVGDETMGVLFNVDSTPSPQDIKVSITYCFPSSSPNNYSDFL